MEPETKRYLNNLIDKLLKMENLLKKVELLRKYESIGLISSIENALYGAFIEALHDVTVVLNVYEGYSLTSEDTDNLLQLINSRLLEIKEKISIAATL